MKMKIGSFSIVVVILLLLIYSTPFYAILLCDEYDKKKDTKADWIRFSLDCLPFRWAMQDNAKKKFFLFFSFPFRHMNRIMAMPEFPSYFLINLFFTLLIRWIVAEFPFFHATSIELLLEHVVVHLSVVSIAKVSYSLSPLWWWIFINK